MALVINTYTHKIKTDRVVSKTFTFLTFFSKSKNVTFHIFFCFVGKTETASDLKKYKQARRNARSVALAQEKTRDRVINVN